MEIQTSTTAIPSYKDYLHPGRPTARSTAWRPAKGGLPKPTGQWNREEIVADGSHIKVTLNGTVITDADLSKIDKPVDGHVPSRLAQCQGLHRLAGARQETRWPSRNARIKELP